MGVWKARFSLRPLTADSRELTGWLDDCTWVENTPSSEEWARNHMVDIQAKEAEYLPDWQHEADKQMLRAMDGR
jgi:hypothetical protein